MRYVKLMTRLGFVTGKHTSRGLEVWIGIDCEEIAEGAILGAGFLRAEDFSEEELAGMVREWIHVSRFTADRMKRLGIEG